MSEFTTEQLEALRDGSVPSSGARPLSGDGSWGTAPRISQNRKVTAPSAIRSSHEDGELIHINKVKGPSLESVAAGQAKDEAERKARAKAESERLAVLEDASPSKVQSRLAFLEREIKKLNKTIRELQK